jgi:hypothetical protein
MLNIYSRQDADAQGPDWPYHAARYGILAGTMHTAKAIGLLLSCADFQETCATKGVNQLVGARYAIQRWQRVHLKFIK